MPGPPGSLLDQHALSRQGHDHLARRLSPQIALVLQTLGAGQPFGNYLADVQMERVLAEAT